MQPVGQADMNRPATVIACDIGGSGGKVFAAEHNNDRLTLLELHRFDNAPVPLGDGLYWDFPVLFSGLCRGLRQAAGLSVSSIAVDAFANDFILLDKTGALLELPHTYRDCRTVGLVERMDGFVSREELYRRTGLQFNRMNSYYQWLALCLERPALLQCASAMLFVPDAVNYYLTGEKRAEYTLASVSQACNVHTRQWDETLTKAIGFPYRLLPPIVEPGSLIGPISPAACRRYGLPPYPVRAAAGHDTACAVAAVPAASGPFAYISSGTWSLVGVETPAPVLNNAARAYGLANEGGICGSTRLLKNVMGLWLLQECQRCWALSGTPVSHGELEALGTSAAAFGPVIDPDDEAFYQPGDMPEAICRALIKLGQPAPVNRGGLIRCILESLALKYRYTLDCLEAATGIRPLCIHIVGGGSQNGLLNQLTADYTNRPVIAGPVEATAMGNACVQLMGMGRLASLKELRALIAASCETRRFVPRNTARHEAHYAHFLEIHGLTRPVE